MSQENGRPHPLPMGVREAEGTLTFVPEECPCDCHAQQSPSIRAVSACIWCDTACQAEYAYWTEIAGGVGCQECAGSPAVRAAVRNAVLRSREL